MSITNELSAKEYVKAWKGHPGAKLRLINAANDMESLNIRMKIAGDTPRAEGFLNAAIVLRLAVMSF